MKTTIKLLIILFGLFASAQSKHFIYTSFEVDVNKATGLIDNPDTIIDNRGLDWNIEAGIRYNCFNIYAFYGRFDSNTTDSRFYNYGAGVDYVVYLNEYLDISAGVAYSPMFKQDLNGNWAGVGSFLARGNVFVWLGEESPLGVKLMGNVINASDKDKGYRLEGSIGIVLRLNR